MARPISRPSIITFGQTRWAGVLPERLREQFLERLKDPSIYSLRNEIALNDLYITRLLQELRTTHAGGETPGPPLVEDRIAFTEEGIWARVMAALELRVKLVAQEVKTMEALTAHGAKQWERAQALNATVIEVLRMHLAATDEGRRTLIAVADELEERVRAMQAEEAALGLPAPAGS